jgi:hypothetical protein
MEVFDKSLGRLICAGGDVITLELGLPSFPSQACANVLKQDPD